MTLALLAAAPSGPLDTWSPTLIALFTLLLPLIALIIILAFTIDSRRLSLAISVVFTLAAAICALLVLAIELAHPLHLERTYTFLQFFTGQSGGVGEFTLQWGVVADPLSAVMLTVVVLASLLIQLYGLSFVRREDGPIRFYSVLLFATFAMVGVVLSISYFQMLVFFALISVSTYLMIGHWWQRPESTAAAGLAFVISVLGDLALLAAMAYVYFRFNELNFQTLSTMYHTPKITTNGVFIMAAIVFLAASAKSAQFPLHVWLPGSAQAPAPAAALLHSAGAALCGVYLIARDYALFHASPRALALLAIVGGVTAILGMVFGLFQGNLKRAIAYTTMGELGLMVLALGISAYGAAVFEALTQAWPKALLFLAAGVVIREMRTEQMAQMGGLWRRMPLTGWVMLIATLAAAGIPPLSGFWSKDAILSKALAIESGPAILVVVAVTVLGAMAAVRIFSLVCLGETARRRRFEPDRIRDAGGRLAFAMTILAIASVIVGAIRRLPGRLDPIAFVTFRNVPLANSHFAAAGIITVAAVAGVAAAWLLYGRARRITLPEPVETAVGEGLYLDRDYSLAAERGLLPAAERLGWVDERVVDGGLIGESLAYAGRPRRWLAEFPIRQLAIGIIAGAFLLALVTILAAGLLGTAG
ncbi:MAG TPA: proton-conducting transporter membrane subunit [Candidatus Dormibacteraeota bacterium]